MELALGVGLGIGLAAIVVAVWRAMRSPRGAGATEAAMQAALHTATSTLPDLRKGLTGRNAERAVPHPAGPDRRRRNRPGRSAGGAGDRRRGARPGARRRPALAPARARRRRPHARRPAADLLRSRLPAAFGRAGAAESPGQADRDADRLLPIGGPAEPPRAAGNQGGELGLGPGGAVARSPPRKSDVAQSRVACAPGAELHPTSSTTRWRRSPADSTPRPEEARDLLIDFAEFTRYLFRDGRSYVTLGEEIGGRRAATAPGASSLPQPS